MRVLVVDDDKLARKWSDIHNELGKSMDLKLWAMSRME